MKAPRVSTTNARRGQFPRTRISTVRRNKRYAVCAGGLHFSAFHCSVYIAVDGNCYYSACYDYNTCPIRKSLAVNIIIYSCTLGYFNP